MIDPSFHPLLKADVLKLATAVAVAAAHYMKDDITKQQLDERMLEYVNEFLLRWTSL